MIEHHGCMRLVPRQLRHASFPSSVPYCGGRLTPEIIAGLGQRPAPPGVVAAGPPMGTAAVPTTGDTAHRLAALDELREAGVLTDREYDDLRRRLTGGA